MLYHGSYLEIAEPDLIHSRSNVDFGRGFYVTPIYEQAAKWCSKFKRRGKAGIISWYTFDESREAELKTLKFNSYSERWLDFILNCRSGKDITDYDLVAGGVANDKDSTGFCARGRRPGRRRLGMEGRVRGACGVCRAGASPFPFDEGIAAGGKAHARQVVESHVRIWSASAQPSFHDPRVLQGNRPRLPVRLHILAPDLSK